MTTPFDALIHQIRNRGFHNQRLQEHSDVVSRGILDDLQKRCAPFRADFAAGRIRCWFDERTPGERQRRIDLLVGEPDDVGRPDLRNMRFCLENKTVVTAHRNRTNRFDDLNLALELLHDAQAEAVLVATVVIGVAERVLNIPDLVKRQFKSKPGQFEATVVPRLSSGDQSLWQEFHFAVSPNRTTDPPITLNKFRKLRTRSIRSRGISRPGHTHVVGYDFVLLVPAFINNVDPPYIPGPDDPRNLGINVQREYNAMLNLVCKAYTARWH